MANLQQSYHNRKKSGTAIVIGASMAGLLAARVLSDHFVKVTLIEKDKFPPPGENRKGVPQGRHTHVLLERGRQIMEKYLPGLTEKLTGQGAVRISDVSSDVSWFHSGAFHMHGQSNMTGIGVSRPTLEASVRERVLSLPNVKAIENCSVTELITTKENDCVKGVYINHIQDIEDEEMMQADLVLDVSGRGSRSPAWLEKIGYKQPVKEEVKIGMGYVSCYFKRRPEHIPGLNGIVFLATPPNRRLGIILAQDKNRWVVTIGGYLGDHAPVDYKGFLNAAKELPSNEIYDVIKNAKPLTDPVSYKFPTNLRRHYEKLTEFPRGYIVMGDALCSFNPIYGQGMTVAAMEAEALDGCLSKNHENPAPEFYNSAGRIIDLSWNAAVSSDLGYPEVEGRRTLMTRFFNWYVSRLHQAAHNDPEVSIAFLKVINMVAPPPSILNPLIIWKIIKGNMVHKPNLNYR